MEFCVERTDPRDFEGVAIAPRTYDPDLSWILLLSAVFLGPSATEAQEGYAGVLEEIIVTARRREENIQTLPLSIAALNADTMRVQGIYFLDDVDELVPNLQIEQSSRANQTEISIRGIGGGNPDPIFPFGTGMYIDGHYISHSIGASSKLPIRSSPGFGAT